MATESKPTTISIPLRVLARALAQRGNLSLDRAQLAASRILRGSPAESQTDSEAEREELVATVAASKGITLAEARASVSRILGDKPRPSTFTGARAPGYARRLARRVAAARGVDLRVGQQLVDEALTKATKD